MREFISVNITEATNTVLENIKFGQTERIPIFNALGRVIAKSEISARTLPPLDNAAMDGYAFKASDTASGSARLKVIGTVAAGDDISSLPTLKSGEAYRIMTGAFVPKGADAVLQHERTDNGKDYVYISEKVEINYSIRSAGEDVKKGEELNYVGRRLTPALLSRFVSAGIFYISVYRKPRIAIISTGNEVSDPGNISDSDKIFDSNSQYAIAFFKALGAEPTYLGIIPDDRDAMLDTFSKLSGYDMIVTSAGISMGDFDYMNLIADKLGITWLFNKVSQKPGGHFSFGTMRGTPIFACPGNPSASASCNFFYVAPAIKKMLGLKEYENKFIEVALNEPFKRKRPIPEFCKGKISNENGKLSATLFKKQNSNMISVLSHANAYIYLTEEDSGELPSGHIVRAYMYDDSIIF